MNSNHLLNQAIQEAFWQGNVIDYLHCSYMELLYQPTFTDSFLLQLAWEKDTLHWYRTTWLRERDREMLDTWLAYLKENEEVLPLELTFLKESGKENALIANDLITEINRLAVKPVFFDDGNWGRDGEEIILKIGTPKSDITYHWHTCATPETWESLNKLVEVLLLTNEKFVRYEGFAPYR